MSEGHSVTRGLYLP